ncbi:MAG: fibronectin type III domain-containing protein [candidate division KSB1 bacterium]|nr:fibronectin type III domain-containing protein [candidate division KSB1 bacterium]
MKTKILFCCIIFTAGFGLYTARAAVNKPMEIVTVHGAECGGFLSKTIDGVRVFVYDQASSSWSPIPFQVDEFREKEGTPQAKEIDWWGDGKLTALDEIVFMAKDLKDKAPDLTAWPNDETSKLFPRYEINCTDLQTGESGYAYIFYSPTLPKSDVSYITYKNDRVYGLTYGIAHHSEVASGFPDSLAIVGNNVDILENWRVRGVIKKLSVQVTYQGNNVTATGSNIHFWEKMKDYNITLTYTFINITIKTTAFHDQSRLLVKPGPIRVLRRHVMGIRFYNNLANLDDTSRVPITTFYYPHYSEFEPAFSLNLAGDAIKTLETEYLSFSEAFNTSAMNIFFFGNNFVSDAGASDTLVNGSPVNVIYKKLLGTADWPGNHWYGFSGRTATTFRNASIITFTTLRGTRIAPNRSPALYYFDLKNSFPDNSVPVYGDAGLQIYDWKKTAAEPVFSIDMRFRSYYLPQNMTRAEMQAFYNKYIQPMTVSITGQNYSAPVDNIPPGRIVDLRVIDRSETTVTLAWTAPGDNGYSGGPAWYYVIRYSTIPPNDPPGGTDWEWWSNANTLQAPPPPGIPGTTQTCIITGLAPGTTYYFRINVVDLAKNTSGLSNVAVESTTPVELAAFTAELLPSRQVALKWRTESETNNLGFAVERRMNDETEWRQIGFVAGVGTTAEAREYRFVDAPPIGSLQYRLKQIDTNGAYEYSGIVGIVLTAPRAFALLQNYPNPFNPSTTIAYEVPAGVTGRLTLQVYDLLGRKIRTLEDKEIQAGYFSISWDGLDDQGRPAPTGVYLYQLCAGDYQATRKMIKVQ